MRKRYIVTGQVQDVGYRTLVKQKARKKGLKGVARNLADGTVEIVCEGEPGAIDGFLKDIDQKTDDPSPLDIDVSNIVESLPAPAGEYKSFEVDYGKKLSFAERSTKDREEITVLGNAMANQKLNGLGQKMDRLGDKMDGVGADVREVGQKVDGVGKAVESVGQKVDGVGKAVESVGQKVDGVGKDVRNMHVDMNKRFDHMAQRYDLIALSLVKAIDRMDRNSKITDKAIEQSRKEAAASNRELAKAVKFMIRKLSDRPIPRKTSGKKKR